jgi:hypothetical protein
VNPSHHELELRRHGKDERRFRCTVSEDWPRLYYGFVEDLCIGPLYGRRERGEVKLIFPSADDRIENAYLLCRYCLKKNCSRTAEPTRQFSSLWPRSMVLPLTACSASKRLGFGNCDLAASASAPAT